MKGAILRALSAFDINENCPNDTGVRECESDCMDVWAQCQLDCKSDFACLSDCNREYASCGETCPCHGDCFDGCPCDNVYCSSTAFDINLLVFNPLWTSSQPRIPQAKMALNYGRDGIEEEILYVELDTPSLFERNRGAMCSFTVANRMIMVGGDGFAYRNRHFEILEGTREIVELPELTMNFERVSCATIKPTDGAAAEYGIVCSDLRDRKMCHVTYDGYNFELLEHETNIDHHNADITDYKGMALFAGGFTDDEGTTEVGSDTAEWEIKSSSNLLSNRNAGTLVTCADRAYIFGGVYGLLSARNDVLVMDGSFQWKTHFQTMNKGRMGFRSVVYSDEKNNNVILHVGGSKLQHIEFWQLKRDGSFTINISKEMTDFWNNWPETFLIDSKAFEPLTN